MNDAYAARLERVVELVQRDTDVVRLDSSARSTLGQLWLHRSTAELTAATMFEGLARDCSSHDLPAAVVELIERAIGDERYHSELAARVAELYLGEKFAAPTPFADALRFESCEATLAFGLRVLLHCALNETVAVAYLTECHREAATPLMRAATRELLRDEIDHARIGWAYLASQRFGSSARERLCRELPSLITLVTNAWWKPTTEASYPSGHGVLTLERTRQVAQDALKTLAVPGLASFGIAPPSAANGELGAP